VSARPFFVNVAAIRRNPGARRPERRVGPIPGLSVTGSEVVPGADVGIDAVLEVISGGIVIAGTVTAPWRGECRRCLRPVLGDLAVDVREIYEPRRGIRAEAASIEAEEETYPLVGDQLDLMPLARDAVLLNLPNVPLCREDCAGLCPQCGADRNEGDCACRQPSLDPRWAALDVLHGRDTP
jgi:uncharacterized protein